MPHKWNLWSSISLFSAFWFFFKVLLFLVQTIINSLICTQHNWYTGWPRKNATPVICNCNNVIDKISLLFIIGVRDQFRLRGLRSVAQIFYPLLAQKSSGFAWILHLFSFFFHWVENTFSSKATPRSLILGKAILF